MLQLYLIIIIAKTVVKMYFGLGFKFIQALYYLWTTLYVDKNSIVWTLFAYDVTILKKKSVISVRTYTYATSKPIKFWPSPTFKKKWESLTYLSINRCNAIFENSRKFQISWIFVSSVSFTALELLRFLGFIEILGPLSSHRLRHFYV